MVFFGQLSRSVVGGALLLSATWKVRHPSTFRASFRSSSPSWLRDLDAPAVVLIVVAEIALGLALFAPWSGSRAASGLAAGLVMVFSIFLLRSPSTEGGCGCWRASRTDKPTRSAKALLFTVGALVAAAALFGTLGLVGLVLNEWVGFRVWTLGNFLWALVWHATRVRAFPGARDHVQARRDLVARGGLGPFYFGAILGTGLLTEAATPLVHVGPFLGLGWGPVAGIAYGLGFALERSVPVWSAAAVGNRLAPHSVAVFFIENGRRVRRAGSLACLGGVFFTVMSFRTG